MAKRPDKATMFGRAIKVVRKLRRRYINTEVPEIDPRELLFLEEVLDGIVTEAVSGNNWRSMSPGEILAATKAAELRARALSLGMMLINKKSDDELADFFDSVFWPAQDAFLIACKGL